MHMPGVQHGKGHCLGHCALRRRASSSHPHEFGQGAMGVDGPESVNNAAATGAIVSMLTLGIPGSATTGSCSAA